MKRILLYTMAAVLLLACSSEPNVNKNKFIKVENGKFTLEGKPYYYMGANYWYAANIGAPENGDQARLVRELDKLKELGVKNFRIQIASEGGDEIEFGVKPSLQPEKGKYNEDLFKGIDFLLSELAKRDMHAVLVLNNYWSWTGGMAKYLNWNGKGEIPYPSSTVPGSWGKYMKYADQFYADSASLADFRSTIKTIVTRKNTITGIRYKNDPSIMAWQLANEPRGGYKVEQRREFINWISETAKYIKSLDENHLVTTGSEGKVGHHQFISDFEKANSAESIDYLCIHMWPQNWSWFNPEMPDSTFVGSVEKAKNYIDEHIQVAEKLNKPVVIEEFGLARDGGKFDVDAPSVWREKFYGWMFGYVHDLAKNGKPVSGTNFWGWSGEGRPRAAGELWQKGDQLIGDPPHEAQGWYAVYDSDSAMLEIISRNAKRMNKLSEQ